MMIKSLVMVGAGVLVAGGGGVVLAHSTAAAPVRQAVTLGAKMSTTKKSDAGWHQSGWMAMDHLMQDAATSLGISTTTLKADIQAGQTLSQIASNHGSSASAIEQSLIKTVDAQIQKAQASGKISPAQATKMEAMASHLIDGMVTHRMPSYGAMGRRFGFMGPVQQKLAAALNITRTTLRSDLRSGESLATIAQNQHMSLTSLENTLIGDAKTAIQSAVTAGKLTTSQATQIESHLAPFIDHMVTQTPRALGNQHGHRWGGPGGYGGLGGLLNDASKALNISPGTLKADLKSGKSLASIAKSANLSVSQLTAKLSADIAASLQSQVQSGKLTASEASTRATQITAMISQFLSGSWGPQHGAMSGSRS